MDAVIADQRGRGNLARAPRQNQVKGKAGFTRAGGSANEHRAIAHKHG